LRPDKEAAERHDGLSGQSERLGQVFCKGLRPPPSHRATSDNHDAGLPGMGRVNRTAIVVRQIQERFLFVLKILQTGISEKSLAELRQTPARCQRYLWVAIEAAEMQDDPIEASEISSADRMRPCGGRMHHLRDAAWSRQERAVA
jgi:hypothetical protein